MPATVTVSSGSFIGSGGFVGTFTQAWLGLVQAGKAPASISCNPALLQLVGAEIGFDPRAPVITVANGLATLAYYASGQPQLGQIVVKTGGPTVLVNSDAAQPARTAQILDAIGTVLLTLVFE